MHHHHFVIALAAVSLVYCGGAPVQTSQCGVSTTTTVNDTIVYRYNERLTGLELELMPHDDTVEWNDSYLSLRRLPDKLPLYIWDGEKFFKSK